MVLACFGNYFFTDLRRFIKSLRWLPGILGVAFSLFIGLESDLFREGLLDGNVLSTYLGASIMTGAVIAYSFCAFPFAGVFPQEREHKYIRYGVIRGNLRSYVASKMAVIYLSSVAVMVLGTYLFLFLCRTQVPWMNLENSSIYDFVLNGCYGSVLEQGHMLWYCGLYALHMGLIAGALSSLAAVSSILLSNTVFVFVFPVLAYRVLCNVSIGGNNINGLYAWNRLFPQDWMNLLFLVFLTASVAVLSGAGCWLGLRRRL